MDSVKTVIICSLLFQLINSSVIYPNIYVFQIQLSNCCKPDENAVHEQIEPCHQASPATEQPPPSPPPRIANESLCNQYADCFAKRGFKDCQCRCKVGYAGDGFHCGLDSDLDGWPDDRLDCGSLRCKPVCFHLKLIENAFI